MATEDSKKPSRKLATRKPKKPRSTGKTPRLPRDTPLLDLIKQIKDGALHPSLLGHADRLQCVRYFTEMGYSAEEIGKFLGRGGRQVCRYRAKLREETKLKADPELAARMAGWHLEQCELAIERIRRATRDPGCSPSEKIKAEEACVGLIDRVTSRLQSLGYLAPTTAKIRAEASASDAEDFDLNTLMSEVTRLHNIQSRAEKSDDG